MSTLIRITAKLPFRSGIPRDVAENVFHFGSASTAAEADMFTFWAPQLVAFYNDILSGVRLGGIMSEVIDRDFCILTGAVVNMTTGHLAPAGPTLPFVLAALVGTAPDLPNEVSLCGSFKNTAATDTPVGRRRGRIYIGPINSSTMASGPGSIPRPTPAVIGRIKDGLSVLANAGNSFGAASADEGDFVIYSRAAHGYTVVNAGWCDNEYDTQRRRGVDATDRVSFGPLT